MLLHTSCSLCARLSRLIQYVMKTLKEFNKIVNFGKMQVLIVLTCLIHLNQILFIKLKIAFTLPQWALQSVQ